MLFCRCLFFCAAVITVSGCSVSEVIQWQHGTVNGAYFSCPQEQVFAPGTFPEPESCFDGEYLPLRNDLSLSALQEMAECFADRNICFVLLLYPDPWEVAAVKLNKASILPNSLRAAEELRAKGIPVIAPWQEILDISEGGLWFYYDIPGDPHPDVPVQKTAARLLAEYLRTHAILPPGNKGEFSFAERPSLAGRKDPRNGADIVDDIVLFNGKPPSFRHNGSPVLIFGNSLCATPSGNELAARLGVELGFMPDCIRIDGAGLSKSMARYFVPGMSGETDGRAAVIIALSVNQLYERWLAPSVIGSLSEASVLRKQMPPEEWQGECAVTEEFDGFMSFISRTWRSADRLSPAEESAVSYWRRTSPLLAGMKIHKNGAPARVCWQDIPVPSGSGRVLAVELFTTAPPGYAAIDIISGADGESVFSTVNTSEADLIRCLLPDDTDSVDIHLELLLPECVAAAGTLTVSTLR